MKIPKVNITNAVLATHKDRSGCLAAVETARDKIVDRIDPAILLGLDSPNPKVYAAAVGAFRKQTEPGREAKRMRRARDIISRLMAVVNEDRCNDCEVAGPECGLECDINGAIDAGNRFIRDTDTYRAKIEAREEKSGV